MYFLKTNNYSSPKYPLFCQYRFNQKYCKMVLTCLKIIPIRCSIHLYYCCPKFKVSLCLSFSGYYFLSQRSPPDSGLKNVWHKNGFNNKWKVIKTCSENKIQWFCIFPYFITFDCKVSLCLSCIVDKILFLVSSINTPNLVWIISLPHNIYNNYWVMISCWYKKENKALYLSWPHLSQF